MTEYPRGTGGCVLYPGTVVRIHRLKSTLGRTQNGKEGVCEFWEPMRCEMHLRFADDPSTHAYSPLNLQKVLDGDKPKPDEEEEDPEAALSGEADKILKIFMKFDANGDGVLDNNELAHILEAIGLPARSVPAFLAAMDKDGDKHVSYEEFVRWALAKNAKSGKRRCEAMWPEEPVQKPATRNSRISIHEIRELPLLLKEQPDVADFSPSEEEEEEMTEEELIEQVGHDLPVGWPEHGLKIVNNMRSRFPDYPIGGVLFMMKKHNYIGGNVIRAIRQTGAREVENMATGIITVGAPGAFPASYRNTCPEGALNVYQQGCENFSFRNMRDSRITPVRTIALGAIFELLEVRRSTDYEFCFGRVADATQDKRKHHWVVLGIELVGNMIQMGPTLSVLSSAESEYMYTSASRVSVRTSIS